MADGSGRGPVDVVQIGYDASVFEGRSGSDGAARQAGYAHRLASARPGSTLTVIVVGDVAGGAVVGDGDVRFVPVPRRAGLLGRIATLARVRRALRDAPATVISSQAVNDEIAWLALWHGRRTGVPVVGQVHSDIYQRAAQRDMSRFRVVTAARMALTERLLPRFAAVRAVGASTARELRRRNGDVHVLPVATGLLDEAEHPRIRSRTGGPPVVLFVGRLVSAKNLTCWLQTAAIVARAVPDATFEIVGDGERRDELERLADGLGLGGRLRFRGELPHRDLAAVYGNADVFLLTSDYEGVPRVVVEAQAFGLPVVASWLAGVEDIVADGVSGHLVRPIEPPRFADHVVALLRDPVGAEAMGARGRAEVLRRFDPAALADAWVTLLIEVADRKAPRR